MKISKYARCLLAWVLSVVILLAPTTAYANGLDMDEVFSGYDSDNYYLDIEELGIMDIIPKITAMLANLLFGLSKMLVDLSVRVFYICSEFNLAEFLQSGFNDAQLSLKNNIFDALMPFAVIATMLYIAMLIIKRNGQALAGQLMQFLAISLAITLLTTNTAQAVSLVDDLTMAVSSQIVSAVYGLGDDAADKGYVQAVAASMWETMVHQPWVMFNLEGDDSLADALLQHKPNSIKRQEIIEDERNNPESTLFLMDKPMAQLPMLIVYLFPVLLKCGIFICIGLLQLAFRIFTIILALMGVLILFLALFPQLGGSMLVGSWLRKILSTQLNIVLLSLLLGIIMLIDKTLYAWLSGVPMGWLLVMAAQAGISIVIFLSREQLIGISQMMSKAVSSPHMLTYNMQRAINSSDRPILNTAQSAGDKLQATVHTRKVNFKERLSQRAEMSTPRAAPHSYSSNSYDSPSPSSGGYRHVAADVITPAPVQRPMLYSSPTSPMSPAATPTAAIASPRLRDSPSPSGSNYRYVAPDVIVPAPVQRPILYPSPMPPPATPTAAIASNHLRDSSSTSDSGYRHVATDVVTPAPVQRPTLYSSPMPPTAISPPTVAASPHQRLMQERQAVTPPSKPQLMQGADSKPVHSGAVHASTALPRADTPHTPNSKADGAKQPQRPQLAPSTYKRQAARTSHVPVKVSTQPQKSEKPATDAARPLLNKPRAATPPRKHRRQQLTPAHIAPPQPKKKRGE